MSQAGSLNCYADRGHRLCIRLLLLVVFALKAAAFAWGVDIVAPPAPFSLNAYDARLAAHMVARAGLLQRRNSSGAPAIVAVRSIRVVFTGVEEDYPEGHRLRYDLLLNGKPLDWDRLYIEYDGRMTSLRLLFTYRNQRPVADIPYFLFEE